MEVTLFMKKLISSKTAFFIALALIVNNKAFSMNKNETQSFQVSAVKEVTRNPNTVFVNWVKNHKLIVSAAVAVAAAAVGLTAWGINRNKTEDNHTKGLEKLALEQAEIERASIFALYSMGTEDRKLFNTVKWTFLYKFKNDVKERIINDIKKRRFKIIEIIDHSADEKILKYSNSGLTESEKNDNCKLEPLTEEVSKKYYDTLDSLANILKGKKISKNGVMVYGNIAENEVYIDIHTFKIVNKKGTNVTVQKDFANILGLALTNKMAIKQDIDFQPGDNFLITFHNNNNEQEYKIVHHSKDNIKVAIYHGANCGHALN